MLLSALGFNRTTDRMTQFVFIVGQEVGQVRVLGVAPQCLDGVKVGRVSRKPLEVDVLVACVVELPGRRTVRWLLLS